MKAVGLAVVFRVLVTTLMVILCVTVGAVEDPIAIADRGVVRILVKHGKTFDEKTASGTGFVVATDGFVVTNNHVVSPPGEVFVLVKQASSNTPKLLPAQVTWASSEYDLALLKVANLSSQPLIISDRLPQKGNKVFAIGYPGVADKLLLDRSDANLNGLVESTVSEGVVGRVFFASWLENGEKINILQHGAPINRGNSGGPLLNGCGQVIGVNTAKALGSIEGNAQERNSVVQADGISYASHVAVLIKELKNKGFTLSINSDGCDAINPQAGAADPIAATPAPTQTNWILFSATGAAVTVALLALFVAFNKRGVVKETFTQYRRRSQGVSIQRSTVKSHPSLLLQGLGSSNQNIRVLINASKCNTGALVIGRDATQCDLSIDDPTVSRRHASITWMDGRWMVSDLGSKNGTSIDGVSAGSRASPVRSGQSVTFGKVTLHAQEVQS